MFETFDHTADVGLRVRAADLNQLFGEAARGLFSLIVVNLADVRPVEEVLFELEADDLEYLFFDWLNELLYAFESRRLLLVDFDVQVGHHGLQAAARGEPLDTSRHELDHEVKAITYHGLKVQNCNGAWLAEVIFDI